MSAESIAQWYASFETLRERVAVEDPRNVTESEQVELDQLRDPSRREAWQWGRVLAKQLLREQLPELVAFDDRIEICSRNGEGKSVRPTVRVNGAPLDVCLSISHSDRGVLVALSRDAQLGIDLVDLSEFRPGSLDAWFTEAECQHLRADDPKQQAILWGIKEAVYKAANTGEPFAPKSVEVEMSDEDFRCTYRGRDLGDACRIHTSEVDGHVAVFATWQTDDRDDMTAEFSRDPQKKARLLEPRK